MDNIVYVYGATCKGQAFTQNITICNLIPLPVRIFLVHLQRSRIVRYDFLKKVAQSPLDIEKTGLIGRKLLYNVCGSW